MFVEVYKVGVVSFHSVQHSSAVQQDMKRGAENQLRRGEEESEASSEVRVNHASQAVSSNQFVQLAVNPGTGFSKSSRERLVHKKVRYGFHYCTY